MSQLLTPASAAAFAFALWAGLGNAGAAPFSVIFLTNPGASVVDVSSKKQHHSYSKSHPCVGDEIPALQRYQPQVLWPRSMRCYPHR
jgi:hypothetical protein